MSKTDKIIRWGLFIILIFSPWYEGAKEILPFSFIQIITYFLLILWIKRSYSFREMDIKKTDLDVPLILFLITAVISTLFSLYFHNSFLYLLKITIYFSIYYLLIKSLSLEPSKFFNFFYNSIIIISCLLSFIGIYQYSKGMMVNATFPNPNFLAGYLVMGIAVGLSNLLVRQTKIPNSVPSANSDNNGKKILKCRGLNLLSLGFYFLSICVMFICLMFTHSRGGLFSLFFTFLFIFGMRFKVWGIIGVLTLGLVLFIIFPPSFLMGVFKMGGIDPYAYQRPNIWKSSIAIMGEKPFSGVGLGNFELGFFKHNFPVKGTLAYYSKYTRFAHNELLQIGAEMGIAALILFLWMVNLFFKKGISMLNKKRQIENMTDGHRKYIAAALCGTVAILSHSLVDFNLHLPAIMLPLIFFGGTIMSFNNRSSSYKISCTCKGSLFWIILFGIFCLLFFTKLIFWGDLYARKKIWQKAVFFNPLNAQYYKELGDSLLKKYDSKMQNKRTYQEKILKAYKRMVLLSPYDSYYHDKLGRFLYEIDSENFLIDALGEYEKAIIYNPTEPFFHFHLASLYFNEEDYEKALYIWQEAVNMSPNFLAAHYWLGITFLNLNKIKKAQEKFLEVLELKNQINDLHNFGSDYEKALIDFDYSLLYDTLGYCYFKEGNLEKAANFYKEAIKINPRFAQAYSNLAGVYFSKKMYKKAESMIKEALKLDPGNKSYKNNLKKIYEKIKG